jgi:hypothetical protein
MREEAVSKKESVKKAENKAVLTKIRQKPCIVFCQ